MHRYLPQCIVTCPNAVPRPACSRQWRPAPSGNNLAPRALPHCPPAPLPRASGRRALSAGRRAEHASLVPHEPSGPTGQHIGASLKTKRSRASPAASGKTAEYRDDVQSEHAPRQAPEQQNRGTEWTSSKHCLKAVGRDRHRFAAPSSSADSPFRTATTSPLHSTSRCGRTPALPAGGSASTSPRRVIPAAPSTDRFSCRIQSGSTSAQRCPPTCAKASTRSRSRISLTSICPMGPTTPARNRTGRCSPHSSLKRVSPWAATTRSRRRLPASTRSAVATPAS